jgi:hypothetical protein
MIRFDLLEVVDSGRGTREYLAACTQLFLDNLLLECGANCSVVPDTDVHVRLVTRSQDLTLNWNTDETYTVDIVASSRGRCKTVFPGGKFFPAFLGEFMFLSESRENSVEKLLKL